MYDTVYIPVYICIVSPSLSLSLSAIGFDCDTVPYIHMVPQKLVVETSQSLTRRRAARFLLGFKPASQLSIGSAERYSKTRSCPTCVLIRRRTVVTVQQTVPYFDPSIRPNGLQQQVLCHSIHCLIVTSTENGVRYSSLASIGLFQSSPVQYSPLLECCNAVQGLSDPVFP